MSVLQSKCAMSDKISANSGKAGSCFTPGRQGRRTVAVELPVVYFVQSECLEPKDAVAP
jgi:hypothetical protein